MKLSYLFVGIVAVGWSADASASTHVGFGVRIGVPPPVVVREAPPPPRVVERMMVAPGPGYVWVPGHYTWVEGRWMWVAGAWLLPPSPYASWVDGRWAPDTHQWIEAHWEIPAPPPMPVQNAQPVAPPPPPPPGAVAMPSSPAPNVLVPNAPSVETAAVVSAEPPPPPVQEVMVERPAPDYVWISGYWGWENGRRQWFRGHWERPPRGYHAWVAPRWEHRGNGYAFIRGYWR
jgi:hypothetical protein